jgi:thymidine phosphorylase
MTSPADPARADAADPGAEAASRNGDAHALRLHRIGIDTYLEFVVFLREDSDVCRAEGFESQSRIELRRGERRIIATLNVVRPHAATPLHRDQAGLSEAAWRALGGSEDERVCISHPAPVESCAHVRAKIFGHAFAPGALRRVIGDIVDGRYSNVEMAAFLTACAGERANLQETIALTAAMIDVGTRLAWHGRPIMDKHCIGGVPGNRTTLIAVPIVAALGVRIPKTSSRAITSPSGTADTMETLAPVTLTAAQMRAVVERENGCIVWGGGVNLSPADDVLIRVERPLDIDGDAQLVASIISKKVAAGSSHVLIDVPVGSNAKVRSAEAASALAASLVQVGAAFGLTVEVMQTDGSQPVGNGIGPMLEARDAVAVLRNVAGASAALRERGLLIAGRILELAGTASAGAGIDLARGVLDDGRAWRKFEAIAGAQGGLRELHFARHRHAVCAEQSGRVARIDNRRIARVAKLSGAPRAAAAGVDLHVRMGSAVARGEPLYTLHAESPGELAYALEYARRQRDIVIVAAQ